MSHWLAGPRGDAIRAKVHYVSAIEDEQAVCEGYREGLSLRDLAMLHGVSHTANSRCLKRNGVKPRTPEEGSRLAMKDRMIPLPEEEIRRRYAAGASLQLLGDFYGVSCHTIRRVVK